MEAVGGAARLAKERRNGTEGRYPAARRLRDERYWDRAQEWQPVK